MQLIDGRPVYSATDLVGFLACRHLTQLERAVLAGRTRKPFHDDPALDRIRRRGEEHEQRYLLELQRQGRAVTELRMPRDRWGQDKGDAIRQAAAATRAAILQGDDVIYQACFFDGTWLGYADFLVRRSDRPSDPLGWSYEVVDTKLARTAKASALVQMCAYVDQLKDIQGVTPERVHVALGGSAREVATFRTDDLMAYYRRAKSAFLAAMERPVEFPPTATYPDPVEHCQVCPWAQECKVRRRRDDDLSLVAGIARRTRVELKDTRLAPSRRALARLDLPVTFPLERTGADALVRVRDQARIQVRGEDAGRPLHELLPLERTSDGQLDTTKGLLALPAPRPGDLFLDLEGDPFAFEDGIDYLFGILELVPDAEPVFHAFWSRDGTGRVTLDAEKTAFERTVDFICERLERDPSIHVYHYATYERTAFGRLMGRHATRETAVDHLFRSGVLVDLYRVVHQSLIASVESYSIKKMEAHYGYVRERDLRDANSAIAAFEAWLEDGGEHDHDDQTLRGIEEYNEDDVRSTWWLREWLEDRRRELERRYGDQLPRPPRLKDAEERDVDAQRTEAESLALTLTAALPADATTWNDDHHAHWLLAQLLGWHRRENKAGWWRYFTLRDHYTDEQRVQEKEPIGMLTLVGAVDGADRTYRYTFPPQEHAVRVGRPALDPDPGVRRSLDVKEIDSDARSIVLRHPVRKNGDDAIHHPTSLVPDLVVSTAVMEKSLLAIGRAAADRGDLRGEGPHRAARDLLLREHPRARQSWGSDLVGPGETTVAAARRLVRHLERSHLPIQGPPGSGKTYTGARMVLDLVEAGCMVAVTANSHKVIGRFLDSVHDAAVEEGRTVRIGQRPGDDGSPTSHAATVLKDTKAIGAAIAGRTLDVIGATAWAWAHADLAGSVDVLVIDEAGQFSLANAIAVSPAAASLVLLGDPQQLDQVIQGSHPTGAERSALAHLLGREKVMPSHLGLFLERTWRLHPSICKTTSELFYEDQLYPQAGNERQGLRGAGALDGTGFRWVPVEHLGNETSSLEEAEVISDMVATVLDADVARWVDRSGRERPIGPRDILIVTPWNTHRAAIEQALIARLGERGRQVSVGTVDKFQGQEAAISIYALGSSSAEDAPRGMGFLYSLNRLNVASSRARCLTVVVGSPRLLDAECVTPEQMRLANALCRIVEVATPVPLPGT